MLPKGTPVRLLGVFAALATFCEMLAFFAAAIYVYDETGSTLAVAVVMTAVTVAETAGAILGGTLADRYDRKRVAGLAAISAAFLMLSLVLHANVAVLTAVLVAATLAASPIRPVIGAALPNLAVDDDLESANGYVQALRNTAVVAGPVVAGLGVAVIGAQGIFFVAALSLLLAAIVLSFVRGSFHAPEASGEDFGSFLEGFAVLRRDSVLLTLTAAGVVALLVAACALVADLPFAIEDLGIGETGYGVLVAMWGIGMTGGSLFAPAIVRRFGAPAVIGTGLVIEGAGILAAAATTMPAFAFAAFLVGGIGGGWGTVANQVVVQERVEDSVRGRARAAIDSLGAASYALSLGFGGFVVALLGARGTYALAAVGCIVAGAAATVLVRQRLAAERGDLSVV